MICIGRVDLIVTCTALALAAGWAHAEAPRQATLYRDIWGVPHVYADNLADAAYALGYAQAEDRLDDIYKNVRTALGTMAEAFGPEHVERDYIMRLVRNAEHCREGWERMPAELRAIGDAFMRGVEAYAAEHPERKPEFAFELQGWHCAAIQRAMILNWPLERIAEEARRKSDPPPFASNSFALAPSRSAENCAVVMTDPHLRWEGMAVFYEARVHAGDDAMCGFWIVGAPFPVLGHTANVAWACTTGGPDTADVYAVELNPENPLQYRCDGEWRDFQLAPIEIRVKGAEPFQRPALYSVYGPVVEEPDPARGVAFCGASPYLELDGLFEQTYRMMKARNAEEFYRALAMNRLMEQNIVFADRGGNIRYVRVGRVPVRPEGYDWSAPVPGGIDATRWQGIHDFRDLVQIENPPQGYLQNCNNSPAHMMVDSPLTPDRYKPYIYNVTWDVQTPRGARMLELLSKDGSVTKQEALDYTLDVYDIQAKAWQAALKAALEALKPAEPAVAAAAEKVLAWDGQFTRESVAAPIVRFWRLKCEKVLPVLDIVEGRPLSADDQAKLLDCLGEAAAEIEAKYGRSDVAWGDINLIGRGGRYFPCPGAEFGTGGQKTYTETVMDVATAETPPGSGKFVGNDGSSSTLVSFLYPDGIESYSVVNWGQSGNPDSPHYLDQAEKLYAERKFKPTWFKKEDLLKHLESEKTLTIP